MLITGLDKIGENQEGEIIIKNLNSSMLRILETCNHTFIFCVLIDLLRKAKDYPHLTKLPTLVLKCLLKVSKIIERLIDQLDLEKIFISIHEYMLVINHDNRSQVDEQGIRITKTLLNEIVKLKRDEVWEPYQIIRCHQQPDHHI